MAEADDTTPPKKLSDNAGTEALPGPARDKLYDLLGRITHARLDDEPSSPFGLGNEYARDSKQHRAVLAEHRLVADRQSRRPYIASLDERASADVIADDVIFKKVGFSGAGEYWAVVLSEPLEVMKFVLRLKIFQLTPNPVDYGLYRGELESALDRMRENGEPFFIEVPGKEWRLRPREAADYLLAHPKTEHLIPQSLKAFLEQPSLGQVDPVALIEERRASSDAETKPPESVAVKPTGAGLWVVAECRRLQAAGKIPEDVRRSRLARILEKRMSEAAGPDGYVRIDDLNKDVHKVDHSHINNSLAEWGLWDKAKDRITTL